MWLSKIPQRKERHSCSQETVGVLHGILQEQQHIAFVVSKTLNLFQTVLALFFSYLTYFLVFSLYFWWFFRVSQDHPGGLFKINPEFESTHSLVNVQAPLIFFISVLPYPKQSLQQMQPVLSTQLHYSVCIPANSQLKRNNDFHLNLTSSEVSDVALTISFLYLVNSNLL